MCKSSQVRDSKRRGVYEKIVLRVVFLHPYRCDHCMRRFYKFMIFAEK
jgi:hypothetical protein